jgi:single-strand DNA-binding protein
MNMDFKKKAPVLNKVVIIGNLTKDPEIRYTTKNVPVCNFRIASSRRFKDANDVWKEDTCFVGIVAWSGLAEDCDEFLRKGCSVLVEGELQSHMWETAEGRKSSVEIHAHKIQFLDRCVTAGPQDADLEQYTDNEQQ